MSTFVRFIVLVLILGVVVNLAMVMFSNDRSQRKQSADLIQEREQLGRAIGRMSDKLRHGEMAVEWQKIDAKDKVLQTSLLVRQFAMTADEQPKIPEELPAVRVVIPGSQVCIDGMRLEFGENYPAEYQEMRGKKLSLFVHVYSDETPAKDRFTFWPTQNEVPQLVQVHNLERAPHVTYFETKLWQTVWDLLQSPERAEKYYDLKILTPEKVASLKVCQEVRRGGFYEMNIGIGGVTIRESNNWVNRNALVEEGKKLKGGGEGK